MTDTSETLPSCKHWPLMADAVHSFVWTLSYDMSNVSLLFWLPRGGRKHFLQQTISSDFSFYSHCNPRGELFCPIYYLNYTSEFTIGTRAHFKFGPCQRRFYVQWVNGWVSGWVVFLLFQRTRPVKALYMLLTLKTSLTKLARNATDGVS